MTTIQGIGCQTYTWEMLGDQWLGTPTDILDAVSAADYDGVEFSNVMIGDYFSSPDRFAADLRQRNLTLAAYAYSTTGFTDAGCFEEDLTGAQKALMFSQEMGVMLCLGGASAPSRDQYDVRFDQAIRFYRTVAEQGGRMGVTVKEIAEYLKLNPATIY
ncbi:MAG: sugar phosphate isomerase/epimerase, partial [Ardenticatenia bacterium]|nr:sugar phosphate isomerase/epimerase [Ardenticatenia bacterium]